MYNTLRNVSHAIVVACPFFSFPFLSFPILVWIEVCTFVHTGDDRISEIDRNKAEDCRRRVRSGICILVHDDLQGIHGRHASADNNKTNDALALI
jgi:hypothetical protein